MKRIAFLTFLFVLCSFPVWGQELAVASFRLDLNDLTAHTPGTSVQDDSGNLTALIKVQTDLDDLSFDGGEFGVVKVVQKDGEVWLYVRQGLQKITVSHAGAGTLKDYYFPIEPVRGCTYIMSLIQGSVKELAEKYGSFTETAILDVVSNPLSAKVYLDDKLQGQTPLTIESVTTGEHTITIEKIGYTSRTGKIMIRGGQRNTVDVDLESKKATRLMTEADAPTEKLRMMNRNDVFILYSPAFFSRENSILNTDATTTAHHDFHDETLNETEVFLSGYGFGLEFALYPFREKSYFIGVGGNFSISKGSTHIEEQLNGSLYVKKLSLWSIQLPVTAGIDLHIGENLFLSPFVGGVVSYNLYGKEENINTGNFKIYTSQDLVDKVRCHSRMQYGATAGLELSYRNISLGVSGLYNFKPYNDGYGRESFGVYYHIIEKLNSLQVRVGFKF